MQIGAWVLAVGACLAGPAAAPGAAGPADGAPWWAPLPRPPLDPPHDVTGDFGEYRTGHFHAGLDFSTGRVVGRPLYASLDGEIVRMRASGVGYGRSLYLQADDGRLLVYGHLDAFAEPLAGYVAAVQESSGQYEQDLWPAAGTFRVRAGERIGWTGSSGAGGPHFHFEIRRSDMAYNPTRAGLAWPDSIAPRVRSAWLEPIDDSSFVERSPAPRRVTPGRRADTLLVQGRVRVTLDAWDPAASGDDMGLWSTRLEWAGRFTELRFDSVSWADGMAEIDYVYDRGRVSDARRRALLLWASSAYRPRTMVSDAPPGAETGTVEVRPGDPPRPLRLVVRDQAGNRAERVLWLRGPGAGEAGPDTLRGPAAAKAAAGSAPVRFEHEALPYPFLRVTCAGVPADVRRVAVEVGERRWPAVRDGRRWTAVVRADHASGMAIRAVGTRADGKAWAADDRTHVQVLRAPADESGAGPFRWEGLDSAEFEPFVLLNPRLSQYQGELRGAGFGLAFGPLLVPLRKPFRVGLVTSASDASARVAIYHDDGSGWSWLRTERDGGRLWAETRRLGSFAVFADSVPPRITPLAAPRRAPRRVYPRWALEARVADGGSGIDARASYFEVEGRRVPSEWDPEAGVLRWRPRVAPSKGTHAYRVVATDRAGNLTRRRGSFVLD